MTIEIGTLVVRGTFGTERAAAVDRAALEAELAEMRATLQAELREEMRAMLAAAERRAREA